MQLRPSAMTIETTDQPANNLVRIWIIVFFAAGLLYLATMAPGILWGDSGEAQLRVLTGQLQGARELARSHVVFFATACGITRSTSGNPVLVANVVTAIAGAVTVANFAVLCALLVRRRVALICGVCLLLFSHTLWQLSAGAEVVTTSTMFMSLEVFCVVRFLQCGKFRWLAVAALANGLGWSTHNFALLTWPAYCITLLSRPPLLATLRRRHLISLVLTWLVGVSPLIISLIYRLDNLDGTGDAMRSVLVGVYGKSVFNLRITGGMAFRVAAYVCLNFPTPLLLFAPLGLWHLLHTKSKSIAWFLAASSFSFFVFAARYKVADQYTFLTHSHLFTALFIAIGLDRLFSANRRAWARSVAIALSCTAPIVYLVLPTVAERYLADRVQLSQVVRPYRPQYEWFLQPWRCGYTGAERYARETLASLPPNAVLLADSTAGRPIDLVQGLFDTRLDVIVPNDIFDRPWQEPFTFDQLAGDQLIAKGLLYSTGKTTRRHWGTWLMGDRYGVEPFGLIYRITHNPAAGDRTNP
ncbi:MAG: DUF2723 domain-containing protein [Planctomycetes bacterium]|nr:DUF2723 domain-containing protein [Planctomycetota bacterium]